MSKLPYIIIGVILLGLIIFAIYKFKTPVIEDAHESDAVFDGLMINIQDEIGAGNYSEALNKIEEAERWLVGRGENTTPFQWAYLYDSKRFSLYETGQKEDAVKVCQEAIQQLNQTQDWPYLPEYNVVRATKRSCYNMIAWEVQEKATNEAELQQAIDAINNCFTTISPIEDKSVFVPFYETKVIIYKKAADFNPEKYNLLFLKSLHELEKNNGIVEDQRVLEALKQENYLEYKKDDPLEKLKLGKENETWKDALDRYRQVLELIGADRDFYGVEIKEKETQESMNKLEESCNCTIPPSLKLLYLEHGAFNVKSTETWGSIRLYSGNVDDLALQIGGMVKTIDLLWNQMPAFEAYFSDEEIKFLNENYFVFGHYYHDDNAFSHLYFDKQGNFGSIFYDQDYFDEVYEDSFKPLLEKSLATQTLDQLISSKVDEAIESLLEEN